MGDGKYLVNAVDRALRILDLFTEDQPELKLTEISQAMGLHKSTVHGLLRTLAHHGYITQNAENGKYRLGLKLVERGNLVMSLLDVRKVAHKVLRQLADQFEESTHLVILDGIEGVYIDKVEGKKAISMYSRIGKRVPVYCTAVGKVLISEREDIPQLIARLSLRPFTPNTITDPERLLQELEQVRKQGYALDNEEFERGMRCVAVPIRDMSGSIVAAMSVSGPVFRMDWKKIQAIVTALKAGAEEISREMGYALSAIGN